MHLKFIYSEKATKFCEISNLLLSVGTVDKSKVEISQTFVAFSEYTNFKMMHCSMFSQFMIYPLISQFGAKSAVLTSKGLVYIWMHGLNMFIEFLDRIEP